MDPVLPNGTFLQNPGLEPSDLAISCLQTVPKAKMEELANLGVSSLIRGSLFRDTSLYGDPRAFHYTEGINSP